MGMGMGEAHIHMKALLGFCGLWGIL